MSDPSLCPHRAPWVLAHRRDSVPLNVNFAASFREPSGPGRGSFQQVTTRGQQCFSLGTKFLDKGYSDVNLICLVPGHWRAEQLFEGVDLLLCFTTSSLCPSQRRRTRLRTRGTLHRTWAPSHIPEKEAKKGTGCVQLTRRLGGSVVTLFPGTCSRLPLRDPWGLH